MTESNIDPITPIEPEAEAVPAQPKFSDIDLDPLVQQALDKMGFETMTKVQALAIPKLLTGCDLIGQAPTGTGKTAAFGVPLISKLKPGAGYVQALIIGPTRELVQQITEELNKIGQFKGIKAMAIFGGESVFFQKDNLRDSMPDIVVGTPGRLLDHLGQISLDFTKTRNVILDEADEMLDMGFLPDIENILKQTPMGRETWLFSATLSAPIRRIAERYMFYPDEVKVELETRTAANIQQFYVVTQEDGKSSAVRQILKDTPDMYGIIFCQTKRDVVLLARKLRERFPVECIHGAMEQSDREKVLEKFRAKELRVLVATDVMARGIDVDKLTHIINYEPPRDIESYIHRIGRTARKGESGIAITLFTPDQTWELQQLEKKICTNLLKHPDSELDFDPNAQPVRQSGHGRGRSSSGGSRTGSGRSGDRNRPRRASRPVVAGDGAATGPVPVVNADGTTPAKKRRNRRRRGPRPEGPGGQATPQTLAE